MNKDYIEIQVRCPLCGEITTVNNITAYEYHRICTRDVPIQTIVPHLSAETRELLMTGICPTCQKGIFGTEEEEESLDTDSDEEPGDFLKERA